MKLWGGRFSKSTNELVEIFTASIDFDQELAQVDIRGSLAHVAMLAQCAILSTQEAQLIQQGLQKIAAKIRQGEVEFRIADEDIHMNIERLLQQEIGAVAGKLHTGRSRNDQVALDLHLYLSEQVCAILAKLVALQQALYQQAAAHIDTILPGYTHLQRAQPIRFAHHLLAYVAMLQRDCERMLDSYKRINISPLGAGALAGAGFDLDREFIVQQLNMSGLYENSLDAVSDRDFVVEFLANAALVMMHLSRLSEELILWSSQEFSFIELDDAFCTGSSMMPQKKNPDVPELVRGKTGRVYGALFALLTMLKGLPLAYNKDMQEDKEGLFDSLKTLHASLELFTPMIATMTVKQQVMQQAAQNDFSNATELADYLVKKNIPFREAHEITGKIVQYCINKTCLLVDLSLAEYQHFSSAFAVDIYQVIALENVVNARSVRGGTAKNAVSQQLIFAKEKIEQTILRLQQLHYSVD
jgi:argininosuccinate lyase